MAFNILRLGWGIDHPRHLPVCKLLILPSFDNPVSWDVVRVFERGADPQLRLYRSVWRMDIDHEVFDSPEERAKHPETYRPTLETAWVLIAEDQLTAILNRFHTIHVPILVPNEMDGMDGIDYELTVGDHMFNVRLGWWCEMPKEWRELQPIANELVRLFESTWADRPQ